MYDISGSKASDKRVEPVNTAELAETVVCSIKFKLLQSYTQNLPEKKKKESSIHQ